MLSDNNNNNRRKKILFEPNGKSKTTDMEMLRLCSREVKKYSWVHKVRIIIVRLGSSWLL